MMERNNNIFVAGDKVLVYLGRPMHNKCSMSLIWGHPFRACGSYFQLFDPSDTLHEHI